jgi:hypothetical protein
VDLGHVCEDSMSDDLEEIETEAARPDHPVEWPKNDPVPDGGVPLPPEQQTPPVEDEE